ncbi:MAG: methylmalonyl-CoA carboxyltransferase [Deltaproteobacteria bacterium]|nr:methylmalonyl-CoA carboxyltransferase [Deltaproteobacteria bacterium]
MVHDDLMEIFAQKKKAILQMGGPEKLAKQRSEGKLNARQRIDRLFDPGSFQEIGMFAHSDQPGMAERTPADGKITGFGKIAGRSAAVVANDLTVLAASSAKVNTKKISYIKRMSSRRGLPLVFLSEAGGGRIPDNMGSINMASSGQDPTMFQRLRESPWVSCLFGPCYGSPTWFACMSDFVVMTRKAVMAVSSPRVTLLATGENTPTEELGGWRIHTEITGLVDAVVETDEECIDLAKKFLSFLPINSSHTPPKAPVPAESGSDMPNILRHLPESRRRIYDIHRILECMVDGGEIFELKKNFGRSVVTSLARLNGECVGIVANNTMHLGGAIDADACDKVTGFLVLCDSFNIPIIMIVDTPGFLIGKEGEWKKTTGKIVNYMNALQLVTVPKISVVIRKSYGQAYQNMGGGKNSDTYVAWPTAEISFMAPEPAVNVAYGITREEDRERFEELKAEVERESQPWEAAGRFDVYDIIEPAQTRDWLIRMLDYHRDQQANGIGRHLMYCWPTSY